MLTVTPKDAEGSDALSREHRLRLLGLAVLAYAKRGIRDALRSLAKQESPYP